MTYNEKVRFLQQSLAGPRERRTSVQAKLSPAEVRMCELMGNDQDEFLQFKADHAARTSERSANAPTGLIVPSLAYASRAVMARLGNDNPASDDDGYASMSVDELCDKACEHLAAREDPDENDPDGRLERASACLMEALNRRRAPGEDGGDDSFLEMRHSRSGPLRVRFASH